MHSPPIFTGYLPVSHRRIVVMPLLPAQRFSHRSSTVSPSEVTTPRPVMTTRRLLIGRDVTGYLLLVTRGASPIGSRPRGTSNKRPSLLVPVLLDVIDGLADGLDLLGL